MPTVSGTISTSNIGGLTGIPTLGSYIKFPLPDGDCTVTIQVSGTWTGTLDVESTLDNATRVAILPSAIASVNTGISGLITGNGIYTSNISGGGFVYIVGLTLTGSAIVTINSSQLGGINDATLLTGNMQVGQTTIASTGTAVQLTASSIPCVNGVTLYNAGATTITVGNSSVNNTATGTGNGDILPAGASRGYTVNNANLVYINGTSGGFVSWSVS